MSNELNYNLFMTVGELKERLKDTPDNYIVVCGENATEDAGLVWTRDYENEQIIVLNFSDDDYYTKR